MKFYKFERYEILLPIKYNDGTPVEPGKFQETRRELVAKFGALTMDTTPKYGVWEHEGKKYYDEMVRFVVDTQGSPAVDRFFSDLKLRLKKRFKQLDIWITATPIRIL